MLARSRSALAAPALVLLAIVGLGAIAPAGARAQGSPSADDIINSLRPGGPMLGGTRGIRPATPAAPAQEPQPSAAVQSVPPPTTLGAVSVPQPQPPAAPSPAVARAAPSVNLSVQFRTNSAELTPAALRTLDELGRALSSQDLAGFRFRIEGHTDTVGSRDANRALSERRAAAVVDYLAGKFNLDRGRMQPVGMGEDSPLVPTPSQTPEPRNRRVQVVNLGA